MKWHELVQRFLPDPPPLTEGERFERIERDIRDNKQRIERLEDHLRLRRIVRGGESNGN